MKKYLLIGIMAFSNLSCQREPAKTTEQITNASEIERAQNKSLSKLNPYSVNPGQWIHFVETQEVISSQGSSSFLSKEWTTEVGQVEKLEHATLLTLFKKVTDYLKDKDFIYEFKNVLSLQPEQMSEALAPLNDHYHSLSHTTDRLKPNNQNDTEVVGVQYQNLQVKRVSLSPPQKVKEAPNCASLPQCKLEGDLITYDIVFLFDDESTQRHSIEWIISEQVPFFAGLLKQCSTSFIPIDNLRVLVKQCREVVDFKN